MFVAPGVCASVPFYITENGTEINSKLSLNPKKLKDIT